MIQNAFTKLNLKWLVLVFNINFTRCENALKETTVTLEATLKLGSIYLFIVKNHENTVNQSYFLESGL